MASHVSTGSEEGEEVMVGQSVWADLPSELLERIVHTLDPLDRVAVRLVCASWRAACVQEFSFPFEIPRLLIRRPERGGELAFFSVQDARILPFALPTWLRASRCCGHVAGWLVMAFDSERRIKVCNPVLCRYADISYPPVFPVSKMVLSGPPTCHGWVLAALGQTGMMIALLQPDRQGAGWMAMGFKEAEQHGGFKDVALWRGDLCALCHNGAVFVFRGNLGLRTVSVSQLRDPERALGMSRGSRWQLYLVDLEGALMLVRKRYESVDDEQVEWDVEVKVLASPEKRSWERVTEIPSHALFVGSVVSEAVPVAAYATSRIREGCVYFARREVEAVVPSAICEYSIEEDDMRYIPVAGGHNADVEPVWITPFM